jgi:hypothetical protein
MWREMYFSSPTTAISRVEQAPHCTGTASMSSMQACVC